MAASYEVREQARAEDNANRAAILRDLRQITSCAARNGLRRRGLAVALRAGFQYGRAVAVEELVEVVKVADVSSIASEEIWSFLEADLVIEARDADGQAVYIAMEIAHTANRRDTGRAIRNAELLTRFTGRPARAAVASVRNDPEIADLIGGGQVYWHEIRDRDLEPE